MLKRGLSPTIAIVLLIVIVIATISIINLFIFPLFKKISLEEVDIRIDTEGGYTFWDEEKKQACIQVKRGVDDADLKRIDVIFSVNGEIWKGNFSDQELPLINEGKTKCFDMSSKPDSIKIIPIFSSEVNDIILPPLTNIPSGRRSGGGEGGTVYQDPPQDPQEPEPSSKALCTINPGEPWDQLDNNQIKCESFGYTYVEKGCMGADINHDWIISNSDRILLNEKRGSYNCGLENLWCSWADINQDGEIPEAGGEDWNLIQHYLKFYCTANNNWCDGADINEDGKVDVLDLSTLANYYSPEIICITPSWCNGADINEDGKVDVLDLSTLGNYYNLLRDFTECNLPINIKPDCYLVPSCEGNTLDTCESNQECLFLEPQLECDSHFIKASWSESLDILADGLFDSFGSLKVPNADEYMEVVDADGDYVLRVNGEYRVHRYERVVVKEFDTPKLFLGGTIFINLKNTVHYNGMMGVNDVVLAGAYQTTQTTIRDFVISAIQKGEKNYICMKAYQHNNYAGAKARQCFEVSDREDGWPDRFIKISWFISDNHELYGNVDYGKWKKIAPLNSRMVSFARFDIGWVSSYGGGSFDIKNITLHDETCLPDWMPVT